MSQELVIIGSGLAGLTATLEAVERGALVTLVTAGEVLSGSSPWAQGGIAAAVGADDSPAIHAADTLAVGVGLNDVEAVSALTHDGRQAALDLIAAGVPFDRGPDGLDLGLEAGHTRRRILHAGGGATGRAVSEALAARVVEHPAVRLRPYSPADELILRGGAVVGVRSGDNAYTGDGVILATGGYASLWSRTTNTPSSRGAGLALAWRAGAALADLEFVQFHPTALVLPDRPAFLLTEALRGEGARVVDGDGQPIVDPLLPRDVVSRAVARYRRDRGPVYLSLRHLDADYVRGRFPNITAQLDAWGLDLARDLLPIAPAAHYCMGGIRTDSDGRTSVSGLYVAGEASCSGVQGANRLASNSLLECLVFGRRAAAAALADSADGHAEWALGALPEGVSALPTSRATQAWDEEGAALGVRLDRDLGVERNGDDLAALIAALPEPSRNTPADLLVASLAARGAWLRRESRGGHCRTDAPATDARWRGRIHWRWDAQAGTCTPRFEALAD